jgi:PKD repeat protein
VVCGTALGPWPEGSPAATSAPLSASISSNVTFGWLPATVGFYSNVSGGVPPYTYDWNFADGCTCMYSQNATHTFTKLGVFMVRFTATDHAGDAIRHWINITVAKGLCGPCPTPSSSPGGSARWTEFDGAALIGGTAVAGLVVGWILRRRGGA